MDGGVDLAITNFFGVDLMKRVQERILRDYLGEQPVGTSMIVETGDRKPVRGTHPDDARSDADRHDR